VKMKIMRGLIHVYTGDGKGKTTAAIGLGIRACGRGLKVFMAQFLKSMETGEIASLKKLEPGFTLYRGASLKKFTWEMDAREMEEARNAQNQIFNTAVDAAFSGQWDVVILDEIMAAVNEGLLGKEKVIDLARNKPGNLELVYTGRNAPAELIELADYVSEIVKVKHPMDKGIRARRGMEF
jgi:cob(I)alamin adenosyltransferase